MNVNMKFMENSAEVMAKKLFMGGLGILPTETVYGLAANAHNSKAIERLYQVKNRPTDHPSIIHIGSFESLNYWVKKVPQYASELMAQFWPGPLTLVLEKSRRAQGIFLGGQNSVAVRFPNHPMQKKILINLQNMGIYGLVIPSANIFGRLSPTKFEHVESELLEKLNDDNDFGFDGGSTTVGIESTIVDCRSSIPNVLRPGTLVSSKLFKTLNLEKESTKTHKVSLKFPGNLPKHYAPKKKVVLNDEIQPNDGVIALANVLIPEGTIVLARPDSYENMARVLYQTFFNADQLNIDRINVLINDYSNEIAIAILDRVKRAASN